nr:TonB-dependent siderophore receptor [Acinetobacter marinus]
MKSYLSLAISMLILSQLSYAADSDTTDEVYQLNTIVVQASDEETSETATASATKFSHDLMDVPFSRSYLSEKLIESQDIQRIDDALSQVSGVFHQSNFGGGFWENYSFRGFQGNPNTGSTFIRNGLSVSRGFSAPRDMLNVESMEFLKGPSAALYGRGEVGGVLNINSKQPQWDTENRVTLRASSQEEYRVSAERTAPINDQLAYRIAVAHEDNQSFRDHVSSEQLFVSPQLSWRLSDATQIDLDTEFTQHLGTFDRGISAVNNRLTMDSSTFTGEPSDGDMRVKDYWYQLRLSHALNPDWKLRSAISYKDAQMVGFSTEPRRIQADGETLERQRRYRNYQTEDLMWQAELLGTIDQDWARHELVIATEAGQYDFKQKQLRRNHSNEYPNWINIYDPVYGQFSPEMALFTDSDERQRYMALNLQDQIFFNDQWNLVLGGRLDHVKQAFENHLNDSRDQRTHNQFSPRIAITYRPTDSWSIYSNYGTAFAMNNGMGRDFQTFDPEESKSVELGSKFQWQDDSELSVAVFDMKKKNVLMVDPVDSNYEATAGEVRSRGVEVDVRHRWTDQLAMSANYSYTDAEVTKDNYLPKGSPLTNVPKHAANLNLNYDFWQHDLQSAGLIANVSYVGSRSGDSPTSTSNGFTLPDYTLFNVSGYYQASPRVRYQLNLHNLFDTEYYLSSYSSLWVQPSEPLKASLSVAWQF